MTVNRVGPRRDGLGGYHVLAAILSLSAQQKPDCTVRLTLLQVNDVYQFAPVDQGTRGGLARLLTLKKRLRRSRPNTLFLPVRRYDFAFS